MPAIFDLLYREYCCARLVEMRKQLLISPPEMHEAPEAPCRAKGDGGASPVGGSETTGRHAHSPSQIISRAAATCH